jgi:peroxiredoxin
MTKLIMALSLSSAMFFSAFSQTTAPDFTLKDLQGKDVSLSSLKGNIIVIDFWAMWCAACKEAFGELNGIQSKYGEKKLVVLGVNLENANPEKVAAFVKKAGITYTVLPDKATSTAKLFEIKGVPSLVIVDRDLNIVKTFRGLNSTTKKEVEELLNTLTSK